MSSRNTNSLAQIKGDYQLLERYTEENIVDHSVRLARIHRKFSGVNVRKSKGQIFTPGTVSRFMAESVKIDNNQIRLLDPGAGTGTLSAAFCVHLVNKATSHTQLFIDAYENDRTILSKLKATLEECKVFIEYHGHEMKYNIYDVDFILHNSGYLSTPLFFVNADQKTLYDIVIANPPYYKLNKDSPQAKAMQELIHGQPNIYALFMALAVCMLKKNGQAVFITPRSFCSGLYYKRFREWFLNELLLTHIHLFESRKEIFDEDNILQENIILKAVKSPHNQVNQDNHIIVSTSRDKSFHDFQTFDLHYSQVVFQNKANTLIKIPSSPTDIQVLQVVDNWTNTLHSLGLEISTGPVVPFRSKEHLFHEDGKGTSVPLLWMHNLQEWNVEWPKNKNGKEQFIRNNKNSQRLLLPTKNYVLLKRFSSKEQKRRLYAAVLLQSEFRQYSDIGIENHLNYIYRPKGVLSEDEVYGIAALLNTFLIDAYFRVLNGNTQVNASDIRILPLPSGDAIREIGAYIIRKKPSIGDELDKAITEILELEPDIVDELIQRNKA